MGGRGCRGVVGRAAQTERLPNVPIKFGNFVLWYYIRLSFVLSGNRTSWEPKFGSVLFFFSFFWFLFSVRFHWLHQFALFPTYSMFTFVIYLVSIFRWIHFILFPFYFILQLFNLYSLHWSFVYYFLFICVVILFHLCISSNLIKHYLYLCIFYLFAAFPLVLKHKDNLKFDWFLLYFSNLFKDIFITCI